MTISSRSFKTTPSPYSWLVVATDMAVHAEHQQRSTQPRSDETQSNPERSQFTVLGALQRVLNSWRGSHKIVVNAG